MPRMQCGKYVNLSEFKRIALGGVLVQVDMLPGSLCAYEISNMVISYDYSGTSEQVMTMQQGCRSLLRARL